MPNFKEQQSKAKSSISHCLNKTKEFWDDHNSLNERIIYLENLSEIKDNLFNRAISNDFRHGGSFGAQQMAYRKAYLNSCNKAVELRC